MLDDFLSPGPCAPGKEKRCFKSFECNFHSEIFHAHAEILILLDMLPLLESFGGLDNSLIRDKPIKSSDRFIFDN